MVLKMVTFIDTESRMIVARGWKNSLMRNYLNKPYIVTPRDKRYF